MRLVLAPDAQAAYQRASMPVAKWADQVFDWIEESPVNRRARAHRFTNGLWAVVRRIGDEDWVILWEDDGRGTAYVRFLGDSQSF